MLSDAWDGFTTVIGKATLVTGLLIAIFIMYVTYETHTRDELAIAGHDMAPVTCTTTVADEIKTVTLATDARPGWAVKIIEHAGRHRGQRAELVTPRHTFALDHGNCHTLELHPFLAGSQYASGSLELLCATPDGAVDAKLDLARCK